MRLPNLLASRNGRLATFFFLYLTEGIPLGFTATAKQPGRFLLGRRESDPA